MSNFNLPARDEWQTYNYSDFQDWLASQEASVQQAFIDAETSPIVFESYDPFFYQPPSYEDCQKIFAFAGLKSEEADLSEVKSISQNSRRFAQGATPYTRAMDALTTNVRSTSATDSELVDIFFQACGRSNAQWNRDTFGSGLANMIITAGTDEEAIFAILDSLSTPEKARTFRVEVESHEFSLGLTLEELLASEFEGRVLGKALGRLKAAERGSNYFLGDAYFGTADLHEAVLAEVSKLGHTNGPVHAESRTTLIEMLSSDILKEEIFPGDTFSADQLQKIPFIALEALAAAHGNVASKIKSVIALKKASDGRSYGNFGALLESLRADQDLQHLADANIRFHEAYRNFHNDLSNGKNFQHSLSLLNTAMGDVMREASVFEAQEKSGLQTAAGNSRALLEGSLIALGASVTIAFSGPLAPALAGYIGTTAIGGTSVAGTALGYGMGLGVAAGIGGTVQTGASLIVDKNIYGTQIDRNHVNGRLKESMLNTSLTAATMGIGAGAGQIGKIAIARNFISQPVEGLLRGIVVSEVSSAFNKGVREGRAPTTEELALYGLTGFASARFQPRLNTRVGDFAFGYGMENIEGNLETILNSGTLSTTDALANAAGAFSEITGLHSEVTNLNENHDSDFLIKENDEESLAPKPKNAPGKWFKNIKPNLDNHGDLMAPKPNKQAELADQYKSLHESRFFAIYADGNVVNRKGSTINMPLLRSAMKDGLLPTLVILSRSDVVKLATQKLTALDAELATATKGSKEYHKIMDTRIGLEKFLSEYPDDLLMIQGIIPREFMESDRTEFTPEEIRILRLRELKREPTKSYRIDPSSEREGLIGMELEESGILAGRIHRDPSGKADFIDADGVKWDVKRFWTKNPGEKARFELVDALASIANEIAQGENVILDTVDMSLEDIAALRRTVSQKKEWADKIIWYPDTVLNLSDNSELSPQSSNFKTL